MSHIDIPIWNKCNNRCIMCTNDERVVRGDFFSYENTVKELNQAIELKNGEIESVCFGGGETTICPHLFKLFDYVYRVLPGATIKLLSNGRMFFYDTFLEKALAIKNPIEFTIPIHGSDAKIHDMITRAEGSFLQTTKGLKKIVKNKKENQKVEIRVIISKLNLPDIPKLIKFISNEYRDVDRVVIIFPELEGFAETNSDEVIVSYGEVFLVLEKIKKYFKIFKEFRLYHFPLCSITSDMWPYAWRTLPSKEVDFLPECKKCVVKKHCLGFHKSYLKFVNKPEINKIDLAGIGVVENKNLHKPIDSVVVSPDILAREKYFKFSDILLADDKKSLNSTKFFLSSLFFRINTYQKVDAGDLRKIWKSVARDIKSKNRNELLNLYIHIPICKSKCSYCMHFSDAKGDEDTVKNYLEKVMKEMSLYSSIFSSIKFSNLYIGGGTPNIFNENQLLRFCKKLFSLYSFVDFAEKNFECNPEYVTEEKMKILSDFGFNRISLGVQSLDPCVLKYANRSYQTYESVKTAIQNVQKHDFHVNVDLLLGLKGDNVEKIAKSFKQLSELKPDSISIYTLLPPRDYLEKYFKGNEKYFYSELDNNFKDVISVLNSIGQDFGYHVPNHFHKNQEYSVKYVLHHKKERGYLGTGSIVGLGTGSCSSIVGIGRYQNYNEANVDISSYSPRYMYYKSTIRDEMISYIISCWGKKNPVSIKSFKKIFNKNIIDYFEDNFNLLNRFEKIKIEGDAIYFLPEKKIEMFRYILFLWDKQELFNKIVDMKLNCNYD